MYTTVTSGVGFFFVCAFAFILKILERDAHGGSCSWRQTSNNTTDRTENTEAAGPSSKRSSVTWHRGISQQTWAAFLAVKGNTSCQDFSRSYPRLLQAVTCKLPNASVPAATARACCLSMKDAEARFEKAVVSQDGEIFLLSETGVTHTTALPFSADVTVKSRPLHLHKPNPQPISFLVRETKNVPHQFTMMDNNT